MVRGLTGTMFMVGRGLLTVAQFEEILEGRDPSQVNFNVPAKGLFLERVRYPENYQLGDITSVRVWEYGSVGVRVFMCKNDFVK